MQWNLNDHLSTAGGRRAFFLPLASIPPGNTTIVAVDKDAFALSESRVDSPTPAPDGVTTDYTLAINIIEPTGGFVNEGNLPDPLIRLHAIGKGRLKFIPSGGFGFDALELELLSFTLTSFSGFPKWWKRWEEAETIPHKIIYENVDAAQLRTLVEAIVPQTTQQSGLNFPTTVTDGNKTNFIDEFFLGNNSLLAEAGTYIGTASTNQGGTPASDDRLLVLHSTYRGHSDASPHPMNPRELFALLFGNDSPEATTHPLLLKMNETGEAQTTIKLRTKRMIIRPPLRTSKRIEWESELERIHNGTEWGSSNNLDSERVFNTHERNGRVFNRSHYNNFKCNIFANDIAIRAGFRSAIHDVGASKWHFMNANSHANHVKRTTGTTDRLPMKGQAEDDSVVWAWKIEPLIRSKPEADRKDALNEAILEEGRCLVIAGARPRKFAKYKITIDPPPTSGSLTVKGIAECDKAFRKSPSGHIVIVKEVKNQPTMSGTVGHGLQKIKVDTFEAISAGVSIRTDLEFRLGGAASSASGAKGFNTLHIFELHPGKDPDTIQGLRDLNVKNRHIDKLKNTDEKAANKPLSHNTDGSVRTDGMCCQDDWPTSNTQTEVTC